MAPQEEGAESKGERDVEVRVFHTTLIDCYHVFRWTFWWKVELGTLLEACQILFLERKCTAGLSDRRKTAVTAVMCCRSGNFRRAVYLWCGHGMPEMYIPRTCPPEGEVVSVLCGECRPNETCYFSLTALLFDCMGDQLTEFFFLPTSCRTPLPVRPATYPG